jgi:hypothetical protein
MYCNHYRFYEKPFDVTPDPRFLYLTSDHRETLASLIYGIQERRGFITIIGEVGTGKTTLLNATLDRMDGNTKVAFIFNTDVTFNEMLSMALYEWGLITSRQSLSRVNAIQRLNNCHWAIVWWTIYTGNYKTREEAKRAKKDYKLIDAIVSKTPYANLLGNFSSESEISDKFHRLEKLGYSTYFIRGKKGTVRLFKGAFVNRKVAEKQNIALKANGIYSQVVKR